MTSFSPLFAFGFGHLAMLGWLGAAAAPLLIHLWNRRRYREVSWAAIEYLLAAMRKNARRIQIEQWILLAVRSLLIVLVVLALAEPYFESLGLKLAAGERVHRLLVIDGSFSMAFKPADKSRFERAKELAAQIVDEGSQGDGFTLVLMSDPPRVVVGSPAFEPGDFNEEIQNLRLVHGGIDLPATLVKVEEIVQRAARDHPRLARHEVYFITDLQRVGWLPDLSASEAGAEFRRLSERLARAAALVVLDVGQDDSENLAITAFRASESLSTIGQNLTADVELKNFGRQARPRQVVQLYVDGHRAAEQSVDLGPQEKGAATFPYRFDSGGDHVLEARLAADALDLDNHRWLSLPVKETIRVLCINGKPGASGLRDTTDYLVVALAPRGDVGESLIRPEVASESALLERDLRHYDCIFLCNVAQFTAGEAQVLDDYLKGGGGLVFFLGDQVQADSYNHYLAGGQPGGVSILPAKIGKPAADSQYHFDPLGYQHPLVGVFRDQEQSGLLTTPIYKYLRLTLPEKSRAKVALGFDSGDPAIVEAPMHRGHVIVVASSADVSWTTMPMWSSYVPIVQELLALAASGQVKERNLQVGQPLGGELRGPGDPTITVETPAGERQAARRAVDDRSWLFADTPESGVYAAQFGPPDSRRENFAVNLSTAESDLTKLSPDELRAEVWPGIEFQHQTNWQNLDEPSLGDISRRSTLHLWFLYGALMLLFIEPLLAWHFGRHRA